MSTFNISAASLNILVIGDVMVDHYIYGDCTRISPEAPVPVVEVRSESYTLGGAGNVVENLHAFGCNVDIVCVVGNDEYADMIRQKLAMYNISKKGVIVDNSRCTTVKTRVLATKHQLIRLDKEVKTPIDASVEEQVLALIRGRITEYDVVLLSDYQKGLLTESLLQAILEICTAAGVKTIIDPKVVDFKRYWGVNIIKPNRKEASATAGIAITDDQSLKAVCIKIKELTNCDDVIITMSEDGMALFSNNELTVIPTKALDVVDVTGAGDTVLASLGLALAANNSLYDACDFANHAAAIVVSKVGSATATLGEITQNIKIKWI